MKKLYITFLLGVACLFTASAQDFWRVITPEHVKSMNQFERVQYTKALKLLTDNQHRAAATEFERFLIQYKDSEVLPYIIFLRAYALHCAKDRNQAVSVYNEVLDFYPDEIDAAAPALYYRGAAFLDNGDYSKGIKSMKELVDDPDYREHPVAARALLSLVHNYWRLNDPVSAGKYLKQIFRDFRDKSSNAAHDARKYYTAYCLSTSRTGEYVSWYTEAYADTAAEKKWPPELVRVKAVNDAYDLVVWNYHWFFNNNDLITKYRGGAKRGSDPGKELWTLLSNNRGNYEKANDVWGYYSRAIRLLAPRGYIPSADFEKLVAEACAFVAKTPDDEKNKGRQQNRYGELINFLFDGGKLAMVSYVNGRITNEKTRAWNEYRVYTDGGKWAEALRHVEGMANKFKDDANLVKRAGWCKGDILRDRMKKYDEAIQAYRTVSDPPGTLWAIVECHKRKGDSNAVTAQLIEIENAFPNEGARAALERANYFHSTGNGEKAIATARYIMKKYPKSGQSSQAHQLLEQYGIDETGGGVVDDM